MQRYLGSDWDLHSHRRQRKRDVPLPLFTERQRFRFLFREAGEDSFLPEGPGDRRAGSGKTPPANCSMRDYAQIRGHIPIRNVRFKLWPRSHIYYGKSADSSPEMEQSTQRDREDRVLHFANVQKRRKKGIQAQTAT